ncbi:hypothetical protein HPP92_022656 [Vanilla planifolia]|uniref:Uncharacterized protein n=1 Tax=Vanilla planifolia TaxID=51239 RepID=A0A835PYP3_VANPL|nr:hypothetical protein HPP92_022656 [Vanilla planifolia]
MGCLESLLDYSDAYDIILMAETVYSLSSLHSLYELTKKCLQYPQGVVYMAGKKHYFGVGGGTRHFVRLVENDGKMRALLLAEVADGSSNIREVWKLSYKMNAIRAYALFFAAFFFSGLMQLAHGQALSKPSQLFDGKTVDLGIAYVLMLAALLITYIIH